MKNIYLFLICFAVAGSINAQSVLSTVELQDYNHEGIDIFLHDYDVYSIDPSALCATLQSSDNVHNVQVNLGDSFRWSLELIPHDIRSENYVQMQGNQEIDKGENIYYRGLLTSGHGGTTRITITDQYIFGNVRDGDDRYFIEPLYRYVPDADPTLHVVYNTKDVVPLQGVTCGFNEVNNRFEDLKEEITHDHNARAGNCYEIDYAIAGDNSMIAKHGSTFGVTAHVNSVVNQMLGFMDDEFCSEYQLIIAINWYPAGADPWDPTTNPGALLASFNVWGNNGGFGVPHDLACLWTNRDLDGSVIGIANLNGLCNFNGYHVDQDFSTGFLLMVLDIHETGHNLSGTHDNGGGFFMSPFVGLWGGWSQMSIDQINFYVENVAQSGCLADCGDPTPFPIADFYPSEDYICEGWSVDYVDDSQFADSWSWTFEGGIPATSTSQNPTVTYPVAGTYTVTLEVCNSFGCDAIQYEDVIEVSDGPDALFTYNQDMRVVNFIDQSYDGFIYTWDFGDGNTSFDISPQHTYDSDGTYTVVLTIENDCGMSSYTQIITISTPPSGGFSWDPGEGCIDLEVNFTDMSSDNTTDWQWEFPGGNPAMSTDQNPTVEYSTTGTYSAKLTASNNAGFDVVEFQNIIVVKDFPLPEFTSTVDNATVTFTNLTTGNPDSYLWDFGDGNTSALVNPIHSYAMPGTYYVELTATNDCGVEAIGYDVEVDFVIAPVAAFSRSAGLGCTPETVEFTDESTNGPTSWQWEFPGATPATSTDADPTVTYNTAGTFTVTLIVSNGAGSDTTEMIDLVTVADGPDANFQAIVDSLTTVSFTNLSTNADNYIWDFGDGNNSMDPNTTHVYSLPGEYAVQLIAINQCGSDTFDLMITTLGEIPSSNFISGLAAGCAPFTVSFTDASTGSPSAWSWDFPGGTPATSTDPNPTVTYDTEGTYDVTLEVTNAYGNSTSTQENLVIVNDVPNATFFFVQTDEHVEFNNGSTNADTYLWDFGDGNTSVDQFGIHDYMENGNFTVWLYAYNECGVDSFSRSVQVTSLAIGDPDFVEEASIFPNPNNGNFVIQLTGTPSKTIDFNVYSTLGRRVHSATYSFINGELSQAIELPEISSGTYFIEVKRENESMYRKIIIK